MLIIKLRSRTAGINTSTYYIVKLMDSIFLNNYTVISSSSVTMKNVKVPTAELYIFLNKITGLH